MEGSGAAALQVLVQNLISVSKEEISLIRGREKDAEKLNETLDIIQKFLNDAETRPISDKAVKSWLKNLEAVAFDADNVLDELKYDVLYKKIKKMKTMKEKVLSCFSSFNHIVRRRQMALTIKEINRKLESINKEATGLGLQSILANAPAAHDAGSETDSFTVDPIFIGRDNDVSRVVEMLTTSPTEQVFSILPIVGMGGLGKTTLARKVYHDKNIRTHFGKHIWVHVSQKFEPLILFEKILTTLKPKNNEVGSRKVPLKESDKIESREVFSKESDEGETREVLLKKLQEALEAKKYLLVLDDIWNQDRRKWDDFINSLTGISSVKGNSIIVTTRNTEVASMVQTRSFHKLENISEDNCWSIIKAKTFGGGDIPPGFETIGRNIAKRCQGLPLAANVVGGVLRGKSKDDWLSIEESRLSDVEGDESNISKILKLSFDNLSSPSLKRCFAYCSIFPKGAHIDRQQLIELWMAEGFLQADQRNDMETVGNKFFNLLLQNSLLQVTWREDNGNIIECNMHDLVHDLSSKVNDNISDGIHQVRYIGFENYGDESSRIPKEQAKCLRTLFFKGEISGNMLSDFKCLHTLNLKGDRITELPSSIRKLIHLRCLDISETGISYLPDSIGELYHLQTLRAYTYFLKKLPITLKYLINLRHLHIPYFTELPPEIGRLTCLQTLRYFGVGDEKGRGIVELKKLKNLKGELSICDLEKVRAKEESKSAYLSQKPNIVELVLRWNSVGEGERNDKNVLEGLQPHPNLKGLVIEGFKGTSFPLWTLKMAVRDELEGHWVGLNNLIEISLYDCKECEEIPILGHLPHLKSLYLNGLNNLRSIGSSFYGIDNCSSNSEDCKEPIVVFPALERLIMSDMPSLTEWVEVEFPSAAETQPREVKTFPCLKELEISDCKGLINLPCEMLKSRAQSLEMLSLKSLSSVTNLPMVIDFLQEMPLLTELEIVNVSQFTHGSSLEIGSPCLKRLEISDCEWLINLPCEMLKSCAQSLERLSIKKLSNVTNLPLVIDILQEMPRLTELEIVNVPQFTNGSSIEIGFPCLKRLEISDCEWLINLPCEILKSCAPSLESLSIKKLSSVTNLPLVIDILQEMPHLTELEIVDVPQFINGSSIKIGSFHSLQQLTIGPTSDSPDYVSFKQTLDGILQGSQSLPRLNLIGMEHWDSLHDQLQHLTTLSVFELNNFGMETLPEWFGNLSSLKDLTLSNCKNLRRLPSRKAMRRLTKLTRLVIEDCPLLKQRCVEQQSDDSEWPKISHIPIIYVDWDRIPSHGR